MALIGVGHSVVDFASIFLSKSYPFTFVSNIVIENLTGFKEHLRITNYT